MKWSGFRPQSRCRGARSQAGVFASGTGPVVVTRGDEGWEGEIRRGWTRGLARPPLLMIVRGG